MLTKSGFLDFLSCKKSFGLALHNPALLGRQSLSAFDRMLAADGRAVEQLAVEHFRQQPEADRYRFQMVFEVDDLHARADVVLHHDDGSIDLFEIKSSTSVKSSGRDHRIDACFQMIVAERAGFAVRRAHLVLLNSGYVRRGEIDTDALLDVLDVTVEAREMEAGVAAQIDEAMAIRNGPPPVQDFCDCLFLGSTQRRCAGFAWLNPDLPHPSAHLLPRISAKRLKLLHQDGRLAMKDVVPADLTPSQLPTWKAFSNGHPVIDRPAISRFLKELEEPLSFYDYETFGSAIPLCDDFSPHKQIPVQFSLHTQAHDELIHHEFLSQAPGRHADLVRSLKNVIPPAGSLLVWNAAFEKACNLRLADLVPNESDFLEDLNERTVDLMLPFRDAYVDARFEGSASIKRVLPVLVPELSYDEARVHDGAGAMEAWLEMVNTCDNLKRDDLRQQLLRYCELDTLAMVKIYQFLVDLLSE